MRLLMTKGF